MDYFWFVPPSVVNRIYIKMNKIALVFAVAITFCWAQNSDPIKILRYDNDAPNPDGSYKYSYETENGISAEEEGIIKNPGSEDETSEVHGSYKYTAPDGTQVSVVYIANENGFQPQGAHFSVAGITPNLQQRTAAAEVEKTKTSSVTLLPQVTSTEQTQTSQVAAEEVDGVTNGEAASEAEASLFRPVYRTRNGNNYRGRYQ